MAAAAGAALLPCALKPHLFLPLAVALLLWVISQKAYGVIAGFGLSLAAGTGIAFFFDRAAWTQYLSMARSERLLHEYAPTVGQAFRDLIDRDAGWLQFVPELAACVWAAWFFWTRRHHWQWMDQGMLVLLVSVVCRPYGWFFDEAVLLPAVMTGLFRARESGRSLIPFAVVGAARAGPDDPGAEDGIAALPVDSAGMACLLSLCDGKNEPVSEASQRRRSALSRRGVTLPNPQVPACAAALRASGLLSRDR